MKKYIIISILFLACTCSSLSATEALETTLETSTSAEGKQSVVAEVSESIDPTPAVSQDVTTDHQVAIKDKKTIISSLKPILRQVKEGTIQLLVAGKDIAVDVFTKDNLIHVMAHVCGAVFLLIIFTCDVLYSAFQTIKWFLLSISTLPR
jgi:hypothetical protein